MFTLIAQTITNPAIPEALGNTPDTPSVALAQIIVTMWRTAVTLGGLALLIMLIIGGLEWILAGGEKGKIEHARERMTQAIIGMGVLAGTIAISLFIGGILGINLLTPTFVDNTTGGSGGTGGGGGVIQNNCPAPGTCAPPACICPSGCNCAF